MDGRNLSSLMMKEEIKEKRPVSSKWLLFTVLGIVFIILAIKQYKPGTWGYYFAHIYARYSTPRRFNSLTKRDTE